MDKINKYRQIKKIGGRLSPFFEGRLSQPYVPAAELFAVRGGADSCRLVC